ncbi:complex I assembly factor TIMMDC1, mitochondrial [Elysia marginata]|uniref:Complex I assembly factor TIMMDC1, mitochondrial n=1 Tax=Elysia marginata TaxID=1093978 RepID=A0AAV4ENG5_9GAST|nr:complex I assembly factor TIMMDC1, mitochondrial [Elysia marginata]
MNFWFFQGGWQGEITHIKQRESNSESSRFLSQIIASYRNKTSVLEYSVAAGITGGLARIQLGVKGFIAGSVLGSILGTMVGCVAYAVFKSYDVTQEQRHLLNIMSLMEVQKSIEGEHGFKQRLEEVKKSQLSKALPAS